ncbi:MAG: NAD(+)/NADH kinase [Nitrospinota bacterium]|nr:NAD(+)/NADH kinase [Nitrospinota bacterium]
MKNKPVKSIGIIVKPKSPLAPQAIARVMEWGAKNGVEILTDRTTGKIVKEKGVEHSTLLDSVDVLLILGGDGTLLASARMATNHSVPLLGVNLGSLGFITEVAYEEMERALEKLKHGDFDIENRLMVNVTVESDKDSINLVALNDVVLSRKNIAKMIELSITVNKEYVTDYKADGLIISSPTGSTAYALSAGGPILYPTLDALVICPICPHTLSNRPLVVPGNFVIEVDLHEGQETIIATLDGQESIDIQEHDHLTISCSEKITRLVKVPGRTHFDTLRSKLGWGGSSKPNG